MNIPSNPVSNKLAAPETVWRPDSNADYGGPAGKADGSAILIESGVASDGSTWRVGELDIKLLKNPHTPKERTSTATLIADTRLAGRVKVSLSELSAASSSNFMDKIRSLAGAIKRIFSFTHPGAAKIHPAPGDRLSYRQTLEAAYSSSSSEAKEIACLTLGKLDALHDTCREIPKMTERLQTLPRKELAGMLKSPSSFEKMIFQAGEMQDQAKGMNNIFIALSHKSGIGFEKKSQLEAHVKEAVATINKVLKQTYVPSNPKLQNLFAHSNNPSFSNLRDTGDNPYEELSANQNFTEADDRELRAWISQGLQVIDRASQMIAAAVINQDDSMNVDAEYGKFVAAGRQN